MWQGILPAHGFMPAASPKALTAISRTIRRWTLHQRSDKSLQDLANMYNPYIGGWINYYGQFYRAQLRSTLQRIDGLAGSSATFNFSRRGSCRLQLSACCTP